MRGGPDPEEGEAGGGARAAGVGGGGGGGGVGGGRKLMFEGKGASSREERAGWWWRLEVLVELDLRDHGAEVDEEVHRSSAFLVPEGAAGDEGEVRVAEDTFFVYCRVWHCMLVKMKWESRG